MSAPTREDLDRRLAATAHLGRETHGLRSADEFARRDEDLVELLGARAFALYCSLGGEILTLGSWRALVREMLFTAGEQAA